MTTVMGNLWQEARRRLAWPTDPRPADRARIIAAAMVFPLAEIVAGYRQQADVSEEDALDHERELRRYLAIAAMYPATRVPITGPVDQLWRIFLDTREYAAFCQQVAGRFIHHEPAPARRRDARRFASLYRRTFGHAPSIVWWPQMALLLPANPGRAKDGSGGCGGWLRRRLWRWLRRWLRRVGTAACQLDAGPARRRLWAAATSGGDGR